jgi:hypothetical protein
MNYLGLLIILNLSFSTAGEQVWEIAKSSSKITVFTTQLPNSLYKSFKAVGIVQSTPEPLFELLDDVSRYELWFAYSKSVQLLKSEQNTKYVYMEINFPWPFRNEDMVYQITVRRNSKGEIRLILDGKPEFIPPVNGVNRMRNASGYILLQPKNEHTTITYVMNMTLSGDIPPWLANKNIHQLPFETLDNLMKIVEK